MKLFAKRSEKAMAWETLTEAYEVRAFRGDGETSVETEPVTSEILHAEQGAFQAIKSSIKGHGEQTVLPDDCQFGDNDMCSVES
jgi:hypothetical protein